MKHIYKIFLISISNIILFSSCNTTKVPAYKFSFDKLIVRQNCDSKPVDGRLFYDLKVNEVILESRDQANPLLIANNKSYEFRKKPFYYRGSVQTPVIIKGTFAEMEKFDHPEDFDRNFIDDQIILAEQTNFPIKKTYKLNNDGCDMDVDMTISKIILKIKKPKRGGGK